MCVTSDSLVERFFGQTSHSTWLDIEERNREEKAGGVLVGGWGDYTLSDERPISVGTSH